MVDIGVLYIIISILSLVIITSIVYIVQQRTVCHFTKQQLINLQYELDNCRQDLAQKIASNNQLNAQLAAEQELTKAEQEKQAWLAASEHRLSIEFENLAQRIFTAKGNQLYSQSKQSLDAVLAPLKEQLNQFKVQVQHVYETETKERCSLKDQLTKLGELNQKMSQDAINLTNALKGSGQQQGAWGEIVLGRVLAESGLREGHEYHTQVVGRNDDGKLIKPDVLVSLPDDKTIIIDSKVSLTAYERFFNANDKSLQKIALTEHIDSLKGHIKQLGDKDYHRLHGIKSLDYVLLFIPIESAFLLALDAYPKLLGLALERNIMLVSPTNLLVALRTIHNIWQVAYQNNNAQQIAEKAGKMYNKLESFVVELQKVGQHLTKAQESYDGAFSKLVSGRGNLIRQAETMRQLNIPIKRPLDAQLIQQSDSTDIT